MNETESYISQAIQYAKEGNPNDMQDSLSAALSNKITDAINLKKIELAGEFFGEKNEDEDEEDEEDENGSEEEEEEDGKKKKKNPFAKKKKNGDEDDDDDEDDEEDDVDESADSDAADRKAAADKKSDKKGDRHAQYPLSKALVKQKKKTGVKWYTGDEIPMRNRFR